MSDFNILAGQTILQIEGLEKNSDEVTIYTEETSGKVKHTFYHNQDCCESVYLSDYDVTSDSLVGGKILSVNEIEEEGESDWGSSTWTFYTVETDKGTLWMRWNGESNGYYSESVDFKQEIVR